MVIEFCARERKTETRDHRNDFGGKEKQQYKNTKRSEMSCEMTVALVKSSA